MSSEESRARRQRSRGSIEGDAKFQEDRRARQVQHIEQVAAEREAIEQAGQAFDPQAMPEWFLDSPLRVTGLRVGAYVLDVVIRHGLKPGTVTEADRPEVLTVSNLCRADCEPLGAKAIRIDLRTAATDAVLWHLASVNEAQPGPVYVGGGVKDWRLQAQVVGQLVEAFARGRPTPMLDEWLIGVWGQIYRVRGAQRELADALGVEPGWLSNRLWRLRDTYGEDKVKKGQPGNPWKRKDTA